MFHKIVPSVLSKKGGAIGVWNIEITVKKNRKSINNNFFKKNESNGILVKNR